MADNASIARPYAKAVFELAQESDSFAGWTGALNRLAAIGGDPEFSGLVNDPRVEGSRLADLLVDLSKDTLPEGGVNLINLLVQNDRLDVLADIEIQYGELVAKAQQTVNATVLTAMPLTPAQRESLEVALQKRLGLKVMLEETIDVSLVGGAIIKAGDLVIDGSARGRLEKLAGVLAR